MGGALDFGGSADGRGSAAGERVYAALRAEILDLALPPDATLSRADLAARFSVSQTPVREALQALEMDGLVMIFPQSRTVVTRIDEIALHETHFLRVAVECEVVRRLARIEGGEAPARARRILAMQNTLVGDTGQMDMFQDLDRSFHRTLFEGVGMGRVHAMVERRQGALARCQRLDLPAKGKMETIVRFHGEILDRIEARDPDGAAGAMRAHLSGSVGRVAELKAQHPAFFTQT